MRTSTTLCVVLFLQGCASTSLPHADGLVAIEQLKVEQARMLTEQYRIQLTGLERYYKTRQEESSLSADVAMTGGIASIAAARGIPSAAPPGFVFSPVGSDRVAAGVDEIAERSDRVAAGVDEIAERSDRVAAGVDEIAERSDRVAAGVDEIAERSEDGEPKDDICSWAPESIRRRIPCD